MVAFIVPTLPMSLSMVNTEYAVWWRRKRDTLHQSRELRCSADVPANSSRLTSIVDEYHEDLREGLIRPPVISGSGVLHG